MVNIVRREFAHVGRAIFHAYIKSKLYIAEQHQSNARDVEHHRRILRGSHFSCSYQMVVTKMIKGLQYETCKYCLRELDLFSLKKEKLKEDFTAVFNYLVCGCREAGSSIFLVVHNKRRTGTNCNKGNSSNVFEKNEFTMSVKHQNRLPREIWMKPEPPD